MPGIWLICILLFSCTLTNCYIIKFYAKYLNILYFLNDALVPKGLVLSIF